MKKLLSITLLLTLISLFSCSNDDDDSNGRNSNFVSVGYKFNKANRPQGTNNLIAIQVYSDGKPYAYGLFDDFSKVDGNFPKGGNYTAKSTIIIDGKIKVAQDETGYLKPFLAGGKSTPLTNRFTKSNTLEMDLLNQSTTTLYDDNTSEQRVNTRSNKFDDIKDIKLPPLDRYYGESSEINIDDDSLIVDMERYVFGLRINVEFIGNEIKDTDFFKLIVSGAKDTITVTPKDEVKTVEVFYTYSTLSKEETPPTIQLRAFTNTRHGEYWEFAPNMMETLYRNDLMILDQTIQKERGIWINPYKWEGIPLYY